MGDAVFVGNAVMLDSALFADVNSVIGTGVLTGIGSP